MLDWLQGNYQFLVGTVLGVVGAWAVLQRRPNTLDFQVTTNTALIRKEASSVGRTLEVKIDGKVVPEPHLMVIRIKNTGKHPVRDADMDRDITIELAHRDPEDASVIAQSDPGVVEADKLYLDMTSKGNIRVAARPRLINPGDWFDVSILTDGKPGDPTVEARWAGQSRKMRDYESAMYHRNRMIVVATGLLLIAVGLLLMVFTNEDDLGEFMLTLGAFPTVIFALIGIQVVAQKVSARRRRSKGDSAAAQKVDQDI